MVHTIPTIFATNKENFSKRFNKLIKVSKYLQIDFMDGKFVKAKSISLSSVPKLKKFGVHFEAHLMVDNPAKWVRKLHDKGFKKIIFHYESQKNSDDLLSLIKDIKGNKMLAFLGINPSTPIKSIVPFLSFLDGVLLMGVNPGKEGQKLISSAYKKIEKLRKIDKNIIIQVDGGVNFSTIKKLANAGVSIVNSGSLVYESDNPKKTIKELDSYFK